MSRAIDKIIGLQRLTARAASRSNSVLKSRSYAWIAPGREATNWSGSRSHSRMLMIDSGKFIRPAPMEGMASTIAARGSRRPSSLIAWKPA